MKALIYKDITSSKTNIAMVSIMVIVLAIYANTKDFLIILPFLMVYLPIVLNGITLASEDQDKSQKFILTLPISRKTYVRSKYLISIFFASLALVLSLMTFKGEGYSLELGLILGVATFFITIAFSAIQIPFILKYGFEKSRIMLVITYFILFTLTSQLSSNFSAIIARLGSLSETRSYILALGILALALLVLFISIRIGTRIVENKEY